PWVGDPHSDRQIAPTLYNYTRHGHNWQFWISLESVEADSSCLRRISTRREGSPSGQLVRFASASARIVGIASNPPSGDRTVTSSRIVLARARAVVATPAAVAADVPRHLRYQTEAKPGSGRSHRLERQENWNPSETALIVCGVWDLHPCLNAV